MRAHLHLVAQALIAVCALLVLGGGNVFAQPDTLWTRIYEGGPGTARDGCLRIIPTFDGGYLLGGYRITGEEATDFGLVKVDSAFEQQWNETYRWRLHDIPYSIAQTLDSCFLMCGYSDVGDTTGLLAKVNHDGELIWTKFYGDGRLQDVFVQPNGNIVVTGISGGKGYLAEMESNGDLEWEASYQSGYLRRLRLTDDDGFILTGQSAEDGNGVEGYVVKTSAQGEEEWNNYYSGSNGGSFSSSVVLEDRNFVFGGVTIHQEEGDEYSHHDFFLVKTDSVGEVIWQRQYHENFDCRLKELITLPDGGLMFVGERFNDYRRHGNYVAYRLNADGEVLWNLYFGPEYAAIFYSVLLLEDNSYLFAGECDPFIGRHTEFWLVRTEPDSFNMSGVRLLDPSFPSLIALDTPYPNPFNSSTTISFSLNNPALVQLAVYGLDGRLVKELWTGGDAYSTGTHRVVWNASALPAGEYLIRLQAGDAVKGTKAVVIK